VAVLATHRTDGSVLLSLVWHEWRGGGFHVWTGPDDVKVRHLRRDPRAAILVAESLFPMRSILPAIAGRRGKGFTKREQPRGEPGT
jgi:hypothetical protein